VAPSYSSSRRGRSIASRGKALDWVAHETLIHDLAVPGEMRILDFINGNVETLAPICDAIT
jgi:hypothetical protein